MCPFKGSACSACAGAGACWLLCLVAAGWLLLAAGSWCDLVAPILLRRGHLSSFSPRKFLLAISTATMVRMSTLVVLLRTSDRKLAFYAAIALKATELIIVL